MGLNCRVFSLSLYGLSVFDMCVIVENKITTVQERVDTAVNPLRLTLLVPYPYH